MSNSASTISAIAAALAAVLAALNLYYSGRRERQHWVRETVVDLLVQYLDASFAASRAADHFGAETSDETRATARQAMDDAHDTQDAALTKLRLTTTRAMVDAAFALHAVDHRFVNVATTTPPCTDEKLRGAREDLWHARHRFVAAGKRVVGLPRQQSRVRTAQLDEQFKAEHHLESR
jgi:hypothetical protein